MTDSYTAHNQYIAYFDILGYKAMMNDDEQSGELFKSVVELADTVITAQEPEAFGGFGFRTLAFSDNFIIVVDPNVQASEDMQLGLLIALVAVIQLHCLVQYGLLIRGGITCGNAFINNYIVYGKGVVSAVNIESLAEYPRIVVDRSVCDHIREMGYATRDFLVYKDIDGKGYVNFFIPVFPTNEGNALLSDVATSLYSYARTSTLSDIKCKIEELIDKNCRYGNLTNPNSISEREKTIRKHAWLIERFNEICDMNRLTDYRINYLLRLNSRTLRYELRL